MQAAAQAPNLRAVARTQARLADSRRALGALLPLLALSAAVACVSGTPAYEVPELPPTRYEALDPLSADRLERALDLLAAGDPRSARGVLVELRAAHPDNLVVGRWLQEAELADAERASRERVEGAPDPRVFAADLRDRYRELAEADPRPTNLVLAARLEDDPPAALHLLDRALALDPQCAWALYGRAHVLASTGRWREARDEIAAALQADPAHLPALRLYSWLLARAGRRAEGIAVLEAWLDHAGEDLRFDRRSRDEAALDLALMLLAEGRADEARERILALHPGTVSQVRRLAAQAAVEHALGENHEARGSARAAQRADPDAILPVVQEALLLEYWLGDPIEAEQAWQRALELASSSDELGDFVQRVRAQVHLERIVRRAENEGAREGEP